MKKILLILSAALFVFAGCEEKQPDPALSVDKDALTFDKDGNAAEGRTVGVASTIDWLVSSDKEWCTVTPLSVRGNATLTVNVTANTGFTDRTAVLTLKGVYDDLSKTVTVTQSKNDYTIGVNPLELSFGFDGSPQAAGNEFTITANADWNITYKDGIGEDWCSVSKVSGRGNAAIAVTAEINGDAHNPRTAELIVTVGDRQSTVTVTQENNPELSESRITSFVVEAYELTGVIDHDARTIGLVYTEDWSDMSASVEVSTWATVTPDPAAPRAYDPPVTFTVTSYDGTSTSVYTVSKVLPPKRSSGFRPGSEKLMWAKKLAADLGITTLHLTGGMAVTNEYVVLNTRAEASVYVNRLTGEKIGAIDLGPDVTGSLVNFYNTADADGNILINNLITASGDFKVWRLNAVTGTPAPYITYNSSVPIGRKLSIKGSLDGDAVITVGINSASSSSFARWKVTGGALVSQTPEIVTISDLSWSNNNVDIVSSSATNANADYFVASYSNNTIAWIDGATNQSRKKLPAMDGNYIANAIDYTVFNGVPYILWNHANSFDWGTSDEICLAEAINVNDFTATYAAGAAPAVGGAIKWMLPAGTYSPWTSLGIQNSNGTGDVAFKVSADGYYLYVYFMYTNGHAVCYRFDCFDIE